MSEQYLTILQRQALPAEAGWRAAEAVDAEFGDALAGQGPLIEWNHAASGALPVRWRWWWKSPDSDRIEVVRRSAPAERSAGARATR